MIDIKTAAMKTFMKTVVSSFLLMAAAVAQAASMMDGFTDPEDGMFDVSHWLAEKKGFFPVPIISRNRQSVMVLVLRWFSCMIPWRVVYLTVKRLTRSQPMPKAS